MDSEAKSLLFLVGITLIAGFIIGLFIGTRSARPDPDFYVAKAELEKALKQMEAIRKEAEAERAKFTAEIEALKKDKQKADALINEIQASINATKQDIAAATLELMKKKAEAQELIKENQQVRDLVAAYDQKLGLVEQKNKQLESLTQVQAEQIARLELSGAFKDRLIDSLKKELDQQRMVAELSRKLLNDYEKNYKINAVFSGIGKAAIIGGGLFLAAKLI